MMDYVRFSSLIFFYYPVSYLALLLGGAWAWVAIIFMTLTQIVIDLASPPDRTAPSVSHPILADAFLYAHLPAGVIMLLMMTWQVSPGDLLGISAGLSNLLGPWVLEAHARSTSVDLIGYGFLTGFILSSNTVAAHELVHRLSNPAAVAIGRWLLAMNLDAQFSISHVFGHHANVGTKKDPATSRRGESLYRFVVRSATGQYVEAVELERKRLQRKGFRFMSFRNQLFRGIAMSFVFIIACYWLGGWRALAAFAIAAAYAKFLFETVNYIQHYGLVRDPAVRVTPRHSWDCLSRACYNAFYALSRHSEHHAKPALAFWTLKPSDFPSGKLHLRFGYLASMVMAMIPPLWFRVTSPMLLEWDHHSASEKEKELARLDNQESGIPTLVAAARSYA